ncbi:unnamed protein product [Meganyctiphanes norvegica]|uniref:procollagen-proline 4-dioxygenase n=1 Tax=Meganyctiphanes norvegica TaxID=48144 RepID=A0AAV2QTY1_MEGNR
MKIPHILVSWCVICCVSGQNFMGSSGRDDLFSATSNLEELLTREGEIVRMVDKYLQAAQERLDTIRSYVNDYRHLTGSGSRGSDTGVGALSSVVAHPIDAYLLLKRLTVEWGMVEDAMTHHANATAGLVQRVLLFREHSTFPDLDDLHGAAVALVRLQDTYRLNMTTLPAGAFTGVGQHTHEFQSVKQLTARDCLFLGKHAFNKGYYDKAIEWFEAALDLVEGAGDRSVPREEIEPFLTAAMNVHDDILEKRGPRGVDWQTNPVPMDKTLAKKLRYSSVAQDTFMPKLYQHQTDQEEEEHYTRLCRGEKLRPSSIESVLVCRYSDNGEAYLRLMPLQLEEMSLDPYIIVMHNFLTDTQTQAVIERAKPRLTASRHRSPDGGFVSSMVRTSKNAWLREADSKDDMMTKMTMKIEKATGLEALAPSAGEDYQVANYGIGGLYVTHTDYLMINPDPAAYLPWEHFIGDRYGTFMVYLSDVEAGGATVFPRAGVTIWPRRGSAAFWWNLYRSGTGDENTRHGACPVLHGSKWISNKWIHYNDQFLKHNCGLNTWDKLSYP